MVRFLEDFEEGGRAIRRAVPWWAKMGIKMVLARANTGLWRRLGIFRLGPMTVPDYAYSVFMKHFDRVRFGRKGQDFVAMELGPGESAFSIMLHRAVGAEWSYLIDDGNYASKQMTLYRRMAALIEARGHHVPEEVFSADGWDEFLRLNRATYLTKGLESLVEIKNQSIDFIWSQAVLEHVRSGDFRQLLRECRRVIRDDGVCSHRVDLRDHLSDSLNNLRFSDQVWESRTVVESGFYTNRLRLSEMVDMFTAEGFRTDVIAIDSWDALPIRRSALAERFQMMADRELLVSGFDVILHPK